MKHIVVASVFTVLLVFAVTFLVSAIDSIGTDYSDIQYLLFIASVAALVALTVVIVWGLPVHFALNKFTEQNLVWYLIAAVIPSFIFIYVFKPFGQDSDTDLVKQALFCSFCGCLGAGVFWYIAVHRQRITKR